MSKLAFVVIICLGLGGMYSIKQAFFNKVKEPNFSVLSTDSPIETREYEPMIIAEVTVHGDRKTAIKRGFSILADYIFGNNTVQDNIDMAKPVTQQNDEKITVTTPSRVQVGKKIKMTAPVIQQTNETIDMTAPVTQQIHEKITVATPTRLQVGEKIKMTTPVIQQTNETIEMSSPVSQQQKGKTWIVRFVMPDKYTLKTLPEPNNKTIRIMLLPTERYVVIRFSGLVSENSLKKHEGLLLDYMAENNLVALSPTKYAFYNPPWTLPFLRRNEIMVQVS